MAGRRRRRYRRVGTWCWPFAAGVMTINVWRRPSALMLRRSSSASDQAVGWAGARAAMMAHRLRLARLRRQGNYLFPGSGQEAHRTPFTTADHLGGHAGRQNDGIFQRAGSAPRHAARRRAD